MDTSSLQINPKLLYHIVVVFGVQLLVVFDCGVERLGLVAKQMFEHFLLNTLDEDVKSGGSFENALFEAYLVEHPKPTVSADPLQVFQVVALLVNGITFFDQLAEQKVEDGRRP
jgi:hypothetical protein